MHLSRAVKSRLVRSLFDQAREHEALKNKWITVAFLTDYLSSIKVDSDENFTTTDVNKCMSTCFPSIDLKTNSDGVYRMKCGTVYVYYITDKGGCCPRPEYLNAVWVDKIKDEHIYIEEGASGNIRHNSFKQLYISNTLFK